MCALFTLLSYIYSKMDNQSIQPETIQYITRPCTTLAQNDCTYRHNQVANIIHQKQALKYVLIQDTNTPYYYYNYRRKYDSQTLLQPPHAYNNVSKNYINLLLSK